MKKTEENVRIKNGITELVFILDRSGSMSGLEKDTVGGFNSMLKKQRNEKGSAFVTTVLFDDKIEFLHDRIEIKNDKEEMYNYLGGVKNDERSDKLDVAFKQPESNLCLVIVVDMWITGFSVDTLTYMYNDKPLQKHGLIQTISRVNRKYPGKPVHLRGL